jgi:hypothetical protein
MYQCITKFTQKDKKFFLKDADIDNGIRPLVDAINSFKYFFLLWIVVKEH